MDRAGHFLALELEDILDRAVALNHGLRVSFAADCASNTDSPLEGVESRKDGGDVRRKRARSTCRSRTACV